MSRAFSLADCSAGVRAAQPSQVRKIFALSARPGIISFASGMPELGGLPFPELAQLAGQLITERGTEVLQYGASTGTDHLKERIVELMALEGIENASADRVIVTTGSQSGLDVLARVLIDPGDVVLAEAPSYAGGMAVFTGAQAEVVQIRTDDLGLVPEELEATIERLSAQGRRVKVLYTIPSFQNPGGTMMPPERRDRVRAICAEHHVLIAEDNPYGLLGFDGAVARAMRADDPEIVYLGSFSKLFAPGLRVGWLVAPEGLYSPLALQAEAQVLNASVFNQELIAGYLDGPEWRETLERYRGLYGRRAAALIEAFEAHMPEGVTWTTPTGGFYSWLRLPESVDAYELCLECIDRGVVFVPGTAFYTDGRGEHEARFSFCHPTEDAIREGVRIVAEVLGEHLERR